MSYQNFYNIFKRDNNKIDMYDKQINLFRINNILMLEVTIFLFFLFPELIQSQLYIDIKVNTVGNVQIISNDYINTLPQVKVKGNTLSLINKKISVDSINDTISLVYETSLNNFSNMFKNIEIITDVHMYNQIGSNNTFSYMFQNCINLKTFIYDIQYNQKFSVKDMRGMFYNCISLESFDFKNLYMNVYKFEFWTTSCSWFSCYSTINYGYYYNDIDMSYTFYNCQNLKAIYSNNNECNYISNMRQMFYNCISLESIHLSKFNTKANVYIDLSYMFFNCINLKIISFSRSLTVSYMDKMFYNCTSLESIDLTGFSLSSEYYLNMSKLFYNCINLTTVSGINQKLLYLMNNNYKTFQMYHLS